MKKVLILGAGRVVKPMVDYFFTHTEYSITVAGLQIESNLKFIKDHPKGNILLADIDNTELISSLVQQHDITVSFLPASFHYKVALLCLEHKKNLVTASYVDEKMKSLHEEAKNKEILLLNEIGLDPGIDHIFTMYMKDKVLKEGGKINSFYSFCGGLPAPEANDNPVGYKFSWSPAGVMRASKNSALYLENNNTVQLSNTEVFAQAKKIEIQGMNFYAYANRDSTKYISLYNFQEIKNVMRGTLRYNGWCEFIRSLLALGLLCEENKISHEKTPLSFMLAFTGTKTEKELRNNIKSKLNQNQLAANQYLDWLGIYSDQTILSKNEMTPFDFIVELAIPLMAYKENERDLVVLCNEIEVEIQGKISKKRISLVDFAQNGDTAMARTVSLPAAIATEAILKGQVQQTGVQIPISPQIYQPVLDKLKELGLSISENM